MSQRYRDTKGGFLMGNFPISNRMRRPAMSAARLRCATATATAAITAGRRWAAAGSIILKIKY